MIIIYDIIIARTPSVVKHYFLPEAEKSDFG
jgi:hypothetical protein